MTTQNDTTSGPTRAKAHPARRWIIAGVLLAAIGTVATAGATMGGHGPSKHGHSHAHGKMTAGGMEKHVDKMVEHLLSDGTADQRSKLKAIAKDAHKDLLPVHQQFHDAHKQAMVLLSAPTIDRVALEQLRTVQMDRMDTATKRILTAVADASEVLTPEQRVKFAEHLKKRMH
jgi:protein CpxP